MVRRRVPSVLTKAAVLWWHIPPASVRRWWQALCASEWSRARALRHQILLWESNAVQIDGAHFIQKVLDPTALVQIIEDLVQERRLTRREGTHLEECLFPHIGKDGTWL